MNCQQTPLLEFLREDLEAEETERVLHHLEDCPECRERLQVIVGLDTIYAQKKTPGKTSRIWRLAAASLLVVLIPSFYFAFFGLSEAPSDLASLATEEKYPYFPLQTRSHTSGPRSETPRPDTRRRAFASYNANNFDEATRWFQRSAPDAEILFYQGVAQYFSEQHDDAFQSLEQSALMERRWQKPALWYQANVFLRTGHEQKVKDILNRLLHTEGEYRLRAQELLRRLRQLR